MDFGGLHSRNVAYFFYSTLFNYAIEQLLSKAVHNIVVKYIYTGVVQNFTNSCFIILINDWLIINKQALINSAMTTIEHFFWNYHLPPGRIFSNCWKLHAPPLAFNQQIYNKMWFPNCWGNFYCTQSWVIKCVNLPICWQNIYSTNDNNNLNNEFWSTFLQCRDVV